MCPFSRVLCFLLTLSAVSAGSDDRDENEIEPLPPQPTIFVLTEYFELNLDLAAELLGDSKEKPDPNALRKSVQQLLEAGDADLIDFSLIQTRSESEDVLNIAAKGFLRPANFRSPRMSPADERKPHEILKTIPLPSDPHPIRVGHSTTTTTVLSADGKTIAISSNPVKVVLGEGRVLERAAHIEGNPPSAVTPNARRTHGVMFSAVKNGDYAFLGQHPAMSQNANDSPARQLLIFLRAWTEELAVSQNNQNQ
ncbi:MAG: hypothetical protein ACI8UO_006338 [Verrucomicrobiales bacterium]|jgi:hypothetical protein